MKLLVVTATLLLCLHAAAGDGVLTIQELQGDGTVQSQTFYLTTSNQEAQPATFLSTERYQDSVEQQAFEASDSYESADVLDRQNTVWNSWLNQKYLMLDTLSTLFVQMPFMFEDVPQNDNSNEDSRGPCFTRMAVTRFGPQIFQNWLEVDEGRGSEDLHNFWVVEDNQNEKAYLDGMEAAAHRETAGLEPVGGSMRAHRLFGPEFWVSNWDSSRVDVLRQPTDVDIYEEGHEDERLVPLTSMGPSFPASADADNRGGFSWGAALFLTLLFVTVRVYWTLFRLCFERVDKKGISHSGAEVEAPLLPHKEGYEAAPLQPLAAEAPLVLPGDVAVAAQHASPRSELPPAHVSVEVDLRSEA